MTSAARSRYYGENGVPASISVIGIDDLNAWLHAEKVKLNELGMRIFKAPEVSLYDYLAGESRSNDVSFERSLVSDLLNRGFSLEELEIEVDQEDKLPWGRMVWYKEHPAYAEPIPDMFEEYAKAKLFIPPYFHAMFKTEHQGDQKFGLYSMQMMTSAQVLLHKTIIFNKVVLRPPA